MTNEEAKKILKSCYPNGAEVIIYTMQEALDKAVEALEKQIAKKPSDEYELIAPSFYICGNCNAAIISKEFSGKRFNFCPYCGQKVDWSKE